MRTNEQSKDGVVKTLIERFKSETPPFFKKLRLVGLSLAAVGGVLVASPIALPAAVVTVGGYLIVAGSVATAVSQVAVKDEESGIKKKEN
jgi:hypothetical protein